MVTCYRGGVVFCVQCVRLLSRVGRALDMAPFSADSSVEEMTNEVIVRAERMSQSDERKTLVIHLQRKVKKLKEKLSDKVSSSTQLYCSVRLLLNFKRGFQF